MQQDNPVHYFTQMQESEGWKTILESFARFVNPVPGVLLVDAGCGPGALVTIFREGYQANAFGADADPEMVKQACLMQGSNRFVTGRLPHLPFMSGVLDIVTASNVIYLVDDPPVALHEIARILKPGGSLFMLNPSEKMSIAAAESLADERGLTGFQRENFIHWGKAAEVNYRWTESEIASLLESAGLTLTESITRIGDGLARYAKGIKKQ